MTHKHPALTFWTIPLLLLMFALGVRGITFDDLWYDEYRTMWYAGSVHYGDISLAETWARVSENAVQTPGYYLILNLWENLAGDSVFANRFPSLLYGLLAVAVIFRAGRELFSTLTGLSAAVMLGGSAFFVLFLHEMRTYTLVMLCVSAAVWLYWRLINNKHDLPTQIFFALVVIGLPYTHYYALMVGGAIALHHLIFVRKNREWWRVPLLMSVTALAFLPWLSVLLRGATDIRSDADRIIFALSPRQIVFGVMDEFSTGNTMMLVFLLVMAIGFGKRAGRTVWLLALGTVGLALLANAWSQSLSQTRYMLMSLPLLALLAGMGITRLAQMNVPPVIPLGLWLMVGVWQGMNSAYVTRVHEPDWYFRWTDMTQIVTQNAQPDDHVLVQLPHLTGAFAHEPLIKHYLHGVPVSTGVVEYPFFMTQADYATSVRDAISDHNRLWVTFKPSLVDPIDAAIFRREIDESGYLHCGTYVDESDLRLDLFTLPPVQFDYHFEEGIQVAAVPENPTPLDDYFAFTLNWRIADDVPTQTYSYGVHITDENGALVVQVDTGLPAVGETCTPVRFDLNNLPAGDYTAHLLVYAWETGDRLQTASGDLIPIEQFSR